MILILGGTEDSIEIAQKLYVLTNEIILSTATEYGMKVARQAFNGTVIYGPMDYNELRTFCKDKDIDLIIDATHPYAEIVSQNAIEVSKELKLTYKRYERPVSNQLDHNRSDESIILCEDYKEAGKLINAGSGNALITTGSRQIEKLIGEINDIKRIYARILPKSEHLAKLETLGLMPEQIIAMKGPFSQEMNKLMLLNTKARYLVTKESGTVGMTDEKIMAAKALAVKVIIIKRPKIDYPNVYSKVDEIIDSLQNSMSLMHKEVT